MAKVKTRYVCQNCGYVSPRYLGRCPNCSEWNTLVEEVEQKSAAVKATPRVTLTGTTNAPQRSIRSRSHKHLESIRKMVN